MFSLHIDTARDWRGGQSQVKYTVLGLRQRGERAALVAHPEGELFKRMSEGLDLIPLAPRNEVDLAAAWRLSRVLRQSGPDVIQAHDPHAVAMAAHGTVDLVAHVRGRRSCATRRVDFHIAQQLVLALEVRRRWTASSPSPTPSRDMLVADGIPRERIGSSTRAWTWSASSACRPPTCTRSATCRCTPRSSATWPRSCPHKGQHYLIDAAALVVRQVPDVRFVILGEGELRETARTGDQAQAPRAPRVPGRVSRQRAGADQELRRVRDELGDRGHVHGARGRDGRVEAHGGHDRRRHSGGAWWTARPGSWYATSGSRKRWPSKLVVLLKDAALRARMGEAGAGPGTRTVHRRADGGRDERGIRTADSRPLSGRPTPRSRARWDDA